jgi:hypothetical protein
MLYYYNYKVRLSEGEGEGETVFCGIFRRLSVMFGVLRRNAVFCGNKKAPDFSEA